MNTDALNASRKEPALKLLGQRKMTARLSPRSNLAQLGGNLAADLLREGAAGVELASRWAIAQAWHFS